MSKKEYIKTAVKKIGVVQLLVVLLIIGFLYNRYQEKIYFQTEYTGERALSRYGAAECEGIWKRANVRVAQCVVTVSAGSKETVFYGYADLGGGRYQYTLAATKDEAIAGITAYQK